MKKLTLEEIWSLYRLIDKSLDGDLNYSFLDGVSKIIKKSSSIRFSSILYVLNINPKNATTHMSNTMKLVKSIKNNNFFDFVKFIRKLING